MSIDLKIYKIDSNYNVTGTININVEDIMSYPSISESTGDNFFKCDSGSCSFKIYKQDAYNTFFVSNQKYKVVIKESETIIWEGFFREVKKKEYNISFTSYGNLKELEEVKIILSTNGSETVQSYLTRIFDTYIKKICSIQTPSIFVYMPMSKTNYLTVSLPTSADDQVVILEVLKELAKFANANFGISNGEFYFRSRFSTNPTTISSIVSNESEVVNSTNDFEALKDYITVHSFDNKSDWTSFYNNFNIIEQSDIETTDDIKLAEITNYGTVSNIKRDLFFPKKPKQITTVRFA